MSEKAIEVKVPLIEKYRPKNLSEIKGQEIAIDKLKVFINSFSKGLAKKKAILFTGPAGTGKTSLALAMAKELNYELFELNASDLRNRKKLDEVMKPSTLQSSLFAKGKIILIDEVDGVTSTEYGGLAELIILIERTQFPVIVTCNDIWQSKFSLLRQKCEIVSLKELDYSTTLDLIKEVTKKEGKILSENILKSIASRSRGDLRAALNDLQSIIDLENPEEEFALREKSQSVFQAIKEILKVRINEKTLEAYDNVDLDSDQITLWLEENIPQDYKGSDLARAFEALSRADIFKGRIHRQQYWHFLVYENFFLTAGISAAKGIKNLPNSFTKYNPPKRILKIWMINQREAKKKTIASKFAELTHTSKHRALRDFSSITLITDSAAAREMNLSDEEQAYLIEKKQLLLEELSKK
jgi:replication factor C large subunit